MPEHITYGIDVSQPKHSLPYIDFPKPVFDRLLDAKVVALPRSKKSASKLMTRISEQPDNMSRVTIMTRRIGRLPETSRPGVYAQVIGFFDKVHTYVSPDEADPKLSLDVWTERLNDGERLGLEIDALWPDKPDEYLAAATTAIMRNVATDTRYEYRDSPTSKEYKQSIDGLVYAQVNREFGVTLQTADAGSCAADTDGQWYDPAKPRFEMSSHNIFSHHQQFIIASGAIALAHIEDLVRQA